MRSVFLAVILLAFSATVASASFPSFYIQSSYVTDVDEKAAEAALTAMEDSLSTQLGFYMSCVTLLKSPDIEEALGAEKAKDIQGQPPSKRLFDTLASVKATSNIVTLQLTLKDNKYNIALKFYAAKSPSSPLVKDSAVIPVNGTEKDVAYAMEGLAERFALAVEENGLSCIDKELSGTVKIENHDTGDLNGMKIRNDVVITCNINGPDAMCSADVASEWNGNGYDMITTAKEDVPTDFKFDVGEGRLHFEIGMITVNETQKTNGEARKTTEQFGGWEGFGPITPNSNLQTGEYLDRIWRITWTLRDE